MMDKLKMHTPPDLAEQNFHKLAEMFPNAVTETTDDVGETVRKLRFAQKKIAWVKSPRQVEFDKKKHLEN